MNTEGEISEDNKMAKTLNFSFLSALYKKPKGERKKHLRIVMWEQLSQNGYKKHDCILST